MLVVRVYMVIIRKNDSKDNGENDNGDDDVNDEEDDDM